jgi:hypothetical protein
LGNAGRGSGLTLFGERRVGVGACRVSGWADGDVDGGGKAGTDTGAGSGTTFAVEAVGSGGAGSSGGASTTGALVTTGVGVGCVVDPLGAGATSTGPGHDRISATAAAIATTAAVTSSGHHLRARATGSTDSAAGTAVVVVSPSIGSNR